MLPDKRHHILKKQEFNLDLFTQHDKKTCTFSDKAKQSDFSNISSERYKSSIMTLTGKRARRADLDVGFYIAVLYDCHTGRRGHFCLKTLILSDILCR